MQVSVAREYAADALAELLVFSPDGVEEIDLDDDTVAYVLYGAEGELPSLPALEARVGEAFVSVATTTIADDWNLRWRSFHRAVTVADTVRVRAPWHEVLDGPLIDVVIEPAQAFGTGAHATTRMCIELLIALREEGHAHGSLVDIGTGSGVLAIAAAKLGWGPIVALDSEQEAVDATRENAVANGVAVAVQRSDARLGPLPVASTITANLIAPLLSQLAALPSSATAPLRLIASGLLADQADEVAQHFSTGHGLREQARRSEGEWVALLLVRP